MTGSQAGKPSGGSVAEVDEGPRDVAVDIEDDPAADVTLVLPPVRNRWRRDLREDVAPEVYAAFLYLRGLIAGDGRTHKVIAEAMGVSPAEFTKRFSLSRENFPPWSSIAPVFGVLGRSPSPFLQRWGQLWCAPWTTPTLTYHGEADRFPELISDAAESTGAPRPDTAPQSGIAAADLSAPTKSGGDDETSEPCSSDDDGAGGLPATAGSKLPIGLESSGFLTASNSATEDDTVIASQEAVSPAPILEHTEPETAVAGAAEDDPATGPILGLPAAPTSPPRVPSGSFQAPPAPQPAPALVSSPSLPRSLVPAPRRPVDPKVEPGTTAVIPGHTGSATPVSGRTRRPGLLGVLRGRAAAGGLAAAVAVAGAVTLATWHRTPPPPPPAPVAAAWDAVVRDAGQEGVTLRSAPAITGNTALGKVAEGASIRVECATTATRVFDDASPVGHTSAVWLRTPDHQFLSSLYVFIAGKNTIVNCQPGLPDLSLTPEVAQPSTTAAAPASSRPATAATAAETKKSSPPKTTISNDQASQPGSGSGQTQSGQDQSNTQGGAGASSQCQPGHVPTSSHGCG